MKCPELLDKARAGDVVGVMFLDSNEIDCYAFILERITKDASRTDPREAWHWYQKAKRLGSAKAVVCLRQLHKEWNSVDEIGTRLRHTAYNVLGVVWAIIKLAGFLLLIWAIWTWFSRIIEGPDTLISK